MDTDLKTQLDSLRALVDSMNDDAEKNDAGSLQAGARFRKQVQELKRVAQNARIFCLQRDHSRKPPKKPKAE